MSEHDDPTAGLPPDLAALLRDPSILVPQDAAVFELIGKWMDAPSDTASAMTVEQWRESWIYSTRRWRETEADLSRAHERTRTLTDALAEQEVTIRNFPRIRAAMKVMLAERGGTFRVHEDRMLDADTGTVHTTYDDRIHVFTLLPDEPPPALAVSPSAEPARCPDCWRPAGRHASDCPSLPIVCRCGQPLTEVHTVTTGVCPTHGVQHAPPAEAGQDA